MVKGGSAVVGGGGHNIAQLRTALEQLESYELPERYGKIILEGGTSSGEENGDPNLLHVHVHVREEDLTEPLEDNDNGTTTRPPVNANKHSNLDQESVHRYRTARDTYLRQRTTELFLQHLPSYDGTSNTFTTFPPPLLTPEAEKDLAERTERTKMELAAISRLAEDKLDMVRAKYSALVERREELRRIVAEMEQSAELVDEDEEEEEEDSSTTMTIEEDEVNDEGMATQEERLAGLIERRAELQAKLRWVQSQRAQVDADVEIKGREVSEMRRRNSGRSNDGKVEDDQGILDEDEDIEEDVDNDDDENEEQRQQKMIEQIEQRTAATLRAVAEMKDAAEWYDGMREAIEELGGMRILGVEQSSSGDTTSTCSPSALTVKVELLSDHILEVDLSSEIVAAFGGAHNRHHHSGEILRVVSARITTPTVITAAANNTNTNEDNNNIMSDPATSSVEVRIRPPDDLVDLATNLPPVDDLRFVVRETQGRIRAAIGRSEELAALRSSYLTKIGPVPRGSEEQEVVCSVPAGVTAVLRLCGDCPLVDGSVYISQIVGVGGWKQSDLDAMKDSSNNARDGNGFASPVALMDALVREIERVTTHGMRGEEEDKTIEMPKTPTLPTRR